MGKKLTKNDIFKIRPVTHIEKVEVEDYPGVIFGIKVMNAGEAESYENTLYDLVEKEDGSGLKTVPLREDSRIKLLLFTVCDPDTGDLLFDKSDLPELRAMSGRAIKKLFNKAREVNEIGKEEEEKTKN